MTREVTVQVADEGRLWPLVVLLAGLVVYLGSIVGLFGTQTWVDVSGLSWSTVSTVLLISASAGLALMAFGCNVRRRAADDELEPIARIERELVGLRQEVAALRGHLEGQSEGKKP